jgi:hypothetical protein
MTKGIELENHPVTEMFPLIQGEEYDKLVEDIRKHGLRELIWLHSDGRIIDGRNRYRACVDARVEPATRTWNGEGSLVNFVVSLNLHRRHLTSSQRAAAAAEVIDQLKAEAKERQREGGRTGGHNKVRQKIAEPSDDIQDQRAEQSDDIDNELDRDAGKATEQAAKMLGTNRTYVAEAAKLKGEDPDVFAAVKAGELSIDQIRKLRDNIRWQREPGKRAMRASSNPKDWVMLLNLSKTVEKAPLSSEIADGYLIKAIEALEDHGSKTLRQAVKQVREEIKAEEEAQQRKGDEQERQDAEEKELEWQERDPFEHFADYLLRYPQENDTLIRHLKNCKLDQLLTPVEKMIAGEEDEDYADDEDAEQNDDIKETEAHQPDIPDAIAESEAKTPVDAGADDGDPEKNLPGFMKR